MDLIASSLLGVSVFFALWFKNFQDSNKIGGNIALSKSLWLSYCLSSWFLMAPYLYFKLSIVTLGALSLSMWIRGLVELYMLYITKNWKPLYGLIHNVFTIFLVTFTWGFSTSYSLPILIYFFSIIASLLFEIYFAYFFHVHLKNKTKGNQAIWFANTEDSLFKINLRITILANLVCYGAFIFVSLN